MTFFISDIHTDIRRVRITRRGATHEAKDVPVGRHKKYARMEKLLLPPVEKLSSTLSDVIGKRSSYITCKDGAHPPVSLQLMSTLLGTALGGRENSSHRNYPSGGGLYPIETYVVTEALVESEPAVFHYNPTEHCLEKLWSLPVNIDLKSLVKKPRELHFQTLIILTSVWKRSSAKYGDFTYTLALLEAGHMSENILLTATAVGLSARPMAGFDDDLIVKLLDIDPTEEQPVHTITLCR